MNISTSTTSINNLTSCTDTNSGKQPTCEPIYWKDETNEQVGIKVLVNEKMEDELQEMSTCTPEMSICMLIIIHAFVHWWPMWEPIMCHQKKRLPKM